MNQEPKRTAVELAAYLSGEAACSKTPAENSDLRTQDWLRGLEDWGPQQLIFAAIALARDASRLWRAAAAESGPFSAGIRCLLDALKRLESWSAQATKDAAARALRGREGLKLSIDTIAFHLKEDGATPAQLLAFQALEAMSHIFDALLQLEQPEGSTGPSVFAILIFKDVLELSDEALKSRVRDALLPRLLAELGESPDAPDKT